MLDTETYSLKTTVYKITKKNFKTNFIKLDEHF